MHDSFNFRFMSRQSDSFIALENEFVSRNMYALIFGCVVFSPFVFIHKNASFDHPIFKSFVIAIQGCFKNENNNLTLIHLRMLLEKFLSNDTTQIPKIDITKALALINQIIRSHVPDFLWFPIFRRLYDPIIYWPAANS